MTNDEVQELQAEIVRPGDASANLDSLNLRIAMQIAPRPWVKSLQVLIGATEQGRPLEEAIRNRPAGMPPELQSLLQAGLKLPEPTRFLLDAIVARRDSGDIRWQLIALTLYPLLMLLLAASVCLLVSNMLYILMNEGFSEFGLTGFDRVLQYVQDQRMALLGVVGILLWCLVVGWTLRWFGPRWAIVAVVGGIPLYGKPLRWSKLVEIAQRLSLISKQMKDPVVAAEAMAASFNGGSQEVVANLTLRRMKSGGSIGVALSDSMLSDGLCAPLLLSVDQRTDVAVGCEQVASILRQLTQNRCRFLGMMMPIFVVMTIATLIWGTISGYVEMMLLLIRMISSLA